MQERDESLECLKTCVRALKEQGEEMQSNPALFSRWQIKSAQTVAKLEKLSEDDKKWFEKEWKTWLDKTYGKEIEEMRLIFG